MPGTESAAAKSRPLGDRERFVAFAFAAADILIEADQEGRIAFATGAARLHLGRAPEELSGAPAASLIAAEDRRAFELALAALPARGRLPPTVMRLADRAGTPFMVSGLHLALPGRMPRACLSFAPMPAGVTIAAESGADARALARIAEDRLRESTAAPGALGFVEVRGSVPPDIQARLDEVLRGLSPAACLTTELAPGRLGVLSSAGQALPDMEAVAARLRSALPGVGLDAKGIPLVAEGLTPVQSVRALRHCLSVFAREGLRALPEEGFAQDLAGFVEKLGDRSGRLARAIRERSFHLEFQPIVALADGARHHFEALLRPAKGLLGAKEGPQEFVTLAEAIGLTEELDLAVLGAALDATARLGAGDRVAVNLSGLSVQSPEFRTAMLTALDSRPETRLRLMIELTESAEIEDEAAAAATLAALRERGIPVCLDDFGAGAAAFRYLRAFEVDYVKVDGAFVEAALRQERDRRFVASMVDLSMAVGAEVIAERIETEQHAQVMRALGVGFGQGYLYGRPGPLPTRAPMVGKRMGVQESWA